MASIQCVGQTDNGCKSSRLQVAQTVETALQNYFFILRQRIRQISGCNGYNLPLRVGKADDLIGHDNVVAALTDEIVADVFSYIVKHDSHPKHEPFFFIHAMQWFHRVKNGCSRHIHIQDMRFAYIVSLCQISG